jgi:hypothetical protein
MKRNKIHFFIHWESAKNEPRKNSLRRMIILDSFGMTNAGEAFLREIYSIDRWNHLSPAEMEAEIRMIFS